MYIYIYICGYGDHQPRNNFGMGVSGVALASTVAELCSALVFVALLRRRGLLAPKPALPATRLAVDGIIMIYEHMTLDVCLKSFCLE